MLTAFFAAMRGRRLVWGEWDCCLFPANWVLTATGRDPAAEWRGLYHDEAGGMAFAMAEGGIPRILDKGMRSAGLKRAAMALNGDVGCVAVDGIAVGSIMYRSQWWVMAAHGCFPAPAARFVMAWSFA